METLRELSAPSDASPVRVILLTAAIKKSQLLEALDLGARGVVLKDSATQVLFTAIQTVMAGEYWMGRERVSDLGQFRIALQSAQDEAWRPREHKINAALEAGYSDKEIAERFRISENTARYLRNSIYRKLGVGFWESAWQRIKGFFRRDSR